jgi:hypothetical protein
MLALYERSFFIQIGPLVTFFLVLYVFCYFDNRKLKLHTFFFEIPTKNYKYFYLKRLKTMFSSFIVYYFQVFNKILYSFGVFLMADSKYLKN